MQRFLQITPELSLIRERHRVLVQYLRLTEGRTLSRSAGLDKADLRALPADPLREVFTNGRDTLRLEPLQEGCRLVLLDPGFEALSLELDPSATSDLLEGLRGMGPRAQGGDRSSGS